MSDKIVRVALSCSPEKTGVGIAAWGDSRPLRPGGEGDRNEVGTAVNSSCFSEGERSLVVTGDRSFPALIKLVANAASQRVGSAIHAHRLRHPPPR